MRSSRFFMPAALLLAVAGPAWASDQPGTTFDQWKEELSGGLNGATDAGQTLLTANITRGAGGLNRITGTLQNTRDVDIFCIRITSPASFGASIPGSGQTAMFLFDSTGQGISGWNGDPANSVGTTASLGAIPSQPVGVYFLAITRNDIGFGSIQQLPLNAAAANIFPGTFGAVTPNAISDIVLSSWSNNPNPGFGNLFNFNYVCTLAGADYHAIPAPGAAALLGLGGLAFGRRRRS